ncbi:MAG: DMT family transporter [Bryobacterales bacterium]|nr:DMT family transporter [Bryobacterales bacterium]
MAFATPHLSILAAAVLFSTGGAAIKAATALSSWQVASFRSGVALVAILVLLPAARSGWNRRVWPAASAYAATLLLFVLATRLTTAANAIFLQSSAPLYLLLLAPWLLGERIRKSDAIRLVVLAAGLFAVVAGPAAPGALAPNPALGNGLAAASGLTWALTLTALRYTARGGAGGGGMQVVAAGNLLAFLAGLPLALPVSGDWLTAVPILLYLGVVQIALAYVCLTRGFRHLPAFDGALILLLEPALNPVWAWWIHGEAPGVWPVLGGVLIGLGTLLGASKVTKW